MIYFMKRSSSFITTNSFYSICLLNYVGLIVLVVTCTCMFDLLFYCCGSYYYTFAGAELRFIFNTVFKLDNG